MNSSKRLARGISWSLSSRIFTQVFQFVFGIALARLLTPENFGVVGMLFVISGFAQAVSDAGLSSALIYDQSADESHFSTVFWLQLGAGSTICAVLFIAAPYISEFYELPTLEPIAKVAALVFVIQALGQCHSAMLSKELRFKDLAIISVITSLCYGIVGVTLAWLGYGVWALVWPGLASSTLSTFLLWSITRWRPRFIFNFSAAKELGRYGLYLLGHTSINYWLRNGEKLLIGRALGAHDLGIYTRAYSLMLLPLNNIGAVLGQVMFPELTRVQLDIPQFRSYYFGSIKIIALIMFPLMIGIAALCHPLIMLLLGEQWVEVIPILQVLSFVAALQSIVFPVGWIFTALGKTKEQFHLSLILGPMFVFAVGIGIVFGLMGVAYSYAIWTLLSAWLNLKLAGGFISLSISDLSRSLIRPLLRALAMGALVYLLDQQLLDAPNYLRVVLGSVVGCLTYLTMCVLSKDETLTQLIRLASNRP